MVKAPIYKKTEPLIEGTILTDQRRAKWSLGPVIGQGGFGCIYSARSESSDLFHNVIKIEPKANGPMFCEINFYRRVAKEDDIKKFMKDKKLDFLGMPRFISSGLFEDNRFLIMDRFGEDLHKILMRERLSDVCLLQICLNMVDVLEYMHSMNYAHADIKALNIMRGFTSPSEVYLLDFGMVSKFAEGDDHKPEKVDPKSKHNGTIEFSARDSHAGLPISRRGDIESLLYNLIFWLSWDDKNPNSSRSIGFGRLPWLSCLQGINSEKISLPTIVKVADTKVKHMKDPKTFIDSVGLGIHDWSKYLVKMLVKVNTYNYTEKPDYNGLRENIAAIISAIDGKPPNIAANRKVCWANVPTQQNPKARTSRKRSSYDMTDNGENKKKIDTVKKVRKIGNVEDKKTTPATSSVLKKKINIFSDLNIDSASDSDSSIYTTPKTIAPRKMSTGDDKPLSKIIKRGKKNTSFLNESSSKENQNESENDKLRKRTKKVTETNNTPEIDPKLIIPGQKQLDALKLRKMQETAVQGSTAVAQTRNTAAAANAIIPGMKTLKRFKKKSTGPRTPRRSLTQNEKPKSLSPANSVCCQTSPSLNNYR